MELMILHQCKEDGWISVQKGCECNWCGQVVKQSSDESDV